MGQNLLLLLGLRGLVGLGGTGKSVSMVSSELGINTLETIVSFVACKQKSVFVTQSLPRFVATGNTHDRYLWVLTRRIPFR